MSCPRAIVKVTSQRCVVYNYGQTQVTATVSTDDRGVKCTDARGIPRTDMQTCISTSKDACRSMCTEDRVSACTDVTQMEDCISV